MTQLNNTYSIINILSLNEKNYLKLKGFNNNFKINFIGWFNLAFTVLY